MGAPGDIHTTYQPWNIERRICWWQSAQTMEAVTIDVPDRRIVILYHWCGYANWWLWCSSKSEYSCYSIFLFGMPISLLNQQRRTHVRPSSIDVDLGKLFHVPGSLSNFSAAWRQNSIIQWIENQFNLNGACNIEWNHYSELSITAVKWYIINKCILYANTEWENMGMGTDVVAVQCPKIL